MATKNPKFMEQVLYERAILDGIYCKSELITFNKMTCFVDKKKMYEHLSPKKTKSYRLNLIK